MTGETLGMSNNAEIKNANFNLNDFKAQEHSRAKHFKNLVIFLFSGCVSLRVSLLHKYKKRSPFKKDFIIC